MWAHIFSALLAVLCILSMLLSLYAVRFATRRTESPLVRLRAVESRLQSLEQCTNETAESLQVVANRIKMQRVRNAANHASDPMNADEPLTYKDQLRRRAGLVAGKPAPHKN